MYGTDYNQGTPGVEAEELQIKGQPGLCKTIIGNKPKQNKFSALKIAYSVTNQLPFEGRKFTRQSVNILIKSMLSGCTGLHFHSISCPQSF